MKLDEFLNEVAGIERFYQKEITEEQKQIWFKELRNLDIKRFKYIVAQVYRTSKFVPKLADILDINTSLGYSQAKQESNKFKCEKCNGTGYLLYKKIIKNGGEKLENEYGSICTCRQKAKYEGWKITDERYRSNYYTPYMEEVRLGE